MLDALKADFEKMKRDQAGERFKNEYRRAETRGLRKGWLRAVFFIAAFMAAAVGVVLVFIPGPAFVFFILSGALLAIQWWPVARGLDETEAKARHLWRRLKARFSRTRHGKRPDVRGGPSALR